MAELVGDAYIRITADTSSMRRALGRQMKSSGKDDAGNYIRSFSQEVEQTADKKMRKAQKTLAKALVDPKVFDKTVKSFDSIEDAAESWRLKLRELSRQHKIATGDFQVFKKAINDWEKAAVKARTTTEQLVEAEERHTAALDRHARTVRAVAKLERDRAAIARQRGTDRDVQLLRSWDQASGKFNRIFGKAFGKGSRNNFLNFVGTIVQGLSTMTTTLLKVPIFIIEKLMNTFGGGGGGAGFGAATKAAAGGMEQMASAGAGMSRVFMGPQGLVAAVAAAGVALFVFAEVLPGIISLVTALAGVVIALAGAITFALVGALLGIAPVLAGGIAGLGAFAIAFTTFFSDKKNKKLVDDFIKPFKEFGKQFQDPIKEFITTMKGGVGTVLKDLTPGVNAFFTGWKKKMTDATTVSALEKWSDSLGRIFTSLSGGFTSLFSGLTGFFVPILPYAEKLANAIESAFGAFDKWANSKEGQTAISGFMMEAWHSAQLVWDILTKIGSILGTMFDTGQDTGQTFLDGILTKLEEIDAFLKTPEGQAKLKEWFGNVEQIGKDIGAIAVAIGEMIAAFNSPEGQKNAKAIMDIIVTIAETGAKIAGLADDISRILRAPFEKAPKKPQQVTALPSIEQQAKSRTGALNEYKMSIKLDDKDAKVKLAAIEAYQSSGVTIPIKGNEALWEATKNSVAAYMFTPKQITIKGNEALWNQTKGTVAAYVFKPKVVPIVPNGAAVYDWVAKWNRTAIQSKTARINVGISKGGGKDITGGIPLREAAGGLFNQATPAIIGEAGPEAVIPLDRPLQMVDASVRSMSAVLQGITGGRGGVPNSGQGPRVNFSEGAIQVHLPTGDPKLAAEAVLDRLVAYIG